MTTKPTTTPTAPSGTHARAVWDEDYWEMFVPGVPVTEGSTRAFKHARTQRVIVRHDNDRKLRAWRNTIRQCAALYRLTPAQGVLIPKPAAARVSISFMLPRPKKPLNPNIPVVKPDLDKLVRAVGDALTEARIFTDDSQLAHINACKCYAPNKDLEGALIAISTNDEIVMQALAQDIEYRINQITGRPQTVANPWGDDA